MKFVTFENYKEHIGKDVQVDIYCSEVGIIYPDDNILIGMNEGNFYFYSKEDDTYWHWEIEKPQSTKKSKKDNTVYTTIDVRVD